MIEAVSPDSQHYERVIELGNANSKTLGLLPYAAIKQAAAEGRVLAYVEDGEVKGYALYGKRVKTGDLSLTHLCVDQDQRGGGIARALVEGIVERNPQRAGIKLSCRKDYDANSMWPQLKFERLGEKPGRSREGLPLVVWWRPIAALTLFEEPEQDDARMVVAIDTNVLLDILEERKFPASLALTADWVTETAELVVTAQSHSELSNEHPSGADFDYALGEFRTLEPTQAAWRAKLKSLQDDPSLARVGGGDLRVVAQAAAGDATYLVSRDEDLVQHGEAIEQLTGVIPIGPDDLLMRLQALGSDHSQTRAIAASGMSFSTISEMPSNAELSVYRHNHIDERSADLKRRLGIVTARASGRVEQLVSESGEQLALGAMYRERGRVIVAVLRGAPGHLLPVAVRQMVHHLRTIVAEEGSATIVVDDQTVEAVDQALRDEGFRSEGSAWEAAVRTSLLRPGDPLPQELKEVGWDRLNAHLVRRYERYAWPSKVFSGSVTSYMVPIQPEYARVILGYEEPQSRLFELNPRAAAARRNVYYRSPRSFEYPARLIWWVSGGGSLGGVRGISWLDEVETGAPRQLHRKYRNYGVLNERQVLAAASSPKKSGQPEVTAMLFSQTEIFPAPVSITRSRELCDSMNKTGFFQTAQQIEEETVDRFYEEGMRNHDR